jgi:hypothetical protein
MKGILFTEPLFHKVISGEKTVTRRIVKPQPDWINGEIPFCESDFRIPSRCHVNEDLDHYFEVKPRYKVGDTVFLKEPYKIVYALMSAVQIKLEYSQKQILINDEDYTVPKLWFIKRIKEQNKSKTGFCNKMFMPEFLAQHFIEITDVRCERLQEITEDDCFKEGVKYEMWDFDHSGDNIGFDPQQAYAALIDKINGKETWESNPYVFRYEFKYIKK